MKNNMATNNLVNLLCDINQVTCKTDSDNFNYLLEIKLAKCYKELNTNYDEILTSLPHINKLSIKIELAEWKLICLNFYILDLLNIELEKSDDEVLSVAQRKNVKKCLENLTLIGIYTKIQPNLPFYISCETNEPQVLFNYNILKCTVYGMCHYLKRPNLRTLILPDCLKGLLVAIYQIAFCPLKKPTGTNPITGSFIMTEEIYKNLMEEKLIFKKMLTNLQDAIHPAIFVKATMILLQSTSPQWFKRAVSQTLTTIMRGQDGVENIVTTLLDGSSNDSTKTWKILDVISKLILSSRDFPDFQENICKQLIGLLDKVTEENLVFERIFTQCTKSLFQSNAEVSKNVLIRRVVSPFLYFTYKEHQFNDGAVITGEIKQNSRLLHAIFVENTVDNPRLPLNLLKSIIHVIYRLYSITVKAEASLNATNIELKEILINYLELTSSGDDLFKIFDGFLFGITVPSFLLFRNDISLQTEQNNIILHYKDQYSVMYSTTDNALSIMALLKNKTDLQVRFFGYLLKCLTERDKYFGNASSASKTLLGLESEFMNEYYAKTLAVYQLLSDLAEDKNVQERVSDKPEDIIKYIKDVLEKTIKSNMHKTTEFESDGFQTVFTVIMILQAFVFNCSKSNLKQYQGLIEPLKEISGGSLNEELKDLIEKILQVMGKKGGEKKTRIVVEEEKTDLDKAIEDVCDPLLPVRGHGLMTLAKLVEKKDKHVIERKQYILKIFQQNLKNEDSFIYLSAINGLAAMADIFPDTVLNILCEEYSDFTKKDDDSSFEFRMKLGEVLVRITKLLGEMAPKYKPLLLNTFLLVSKDDDDLIRASSLSNLAEVCRILGYKLGSIATEVLVCVHAIIATDKSVEARRAALTVIRQLFVGLDSEMIAFLKDDILPIYRTLKQIYNGDNDEVMRLHAQLALEELNENMKKFVLPNLQLNVEKKIVMLD